MEGVIEMSTEIPVCNFESSKFSMIDSYEVVRILRRHGTEIDWGNGCGECFFYGPDKDHLAQIMKSDGNTFVLGLTHDDKTVVSAFDEFFQSTADMEKTPGEFPFVYTWSV